jgi:hypothetical protein
MITNFNLFSESLLLESIINESILYYSRDTRSVLKRLKDNEIAKDLLSVEKTDIKPDITFVNLDKEKDGYLSFITMRNAAKLISDRYPHLDYMDKRPDIALADELWDLRDSSSGAEVYDKSRNSIKIGKLVNKIFPGKYTDKDIEEFVNKFKASIDGSDVFELVDGTDIDHWYNYKNYVDENKGNLGNSCMKSKSGLFGIYNENPDVCKLLILKEDDKISGRALVWKLKSIKRMRTEVEGVEWFMDRQYTNNDSDVEKFRNYAKEKGWAFKTNNNHHSFTNVTFNGEEFNAELEVEVKAKDYRRYPYMDTFRRFDPNTGILYNDDERESDNEGQYILEDTGGGYEEIEGGFWSEWHDRMIPEDEAVYSEPYSDYLLRDYAVRVYVGSSRRRGWYSEDDDDIVYDEYSDEYVHVDDAVYSEIYGNWIWDERAVKTITEIYNDGDVENAEGYWCHVNDRDIVSLYGMSRMLWYKKLCDKYSDWDDYDYINTDILTRNYKDEWIPNILERTIYKVGEAKSSDSPDIYGVEYLLEEDAIALDYEINMDNSRVIDIIQYNEDTDEILESVLNKLKIKIKQLTDILDDKGQKRLVFDEDDEYEYRRKVSRLKDKLMSRYEELDSEEWHNL